LSGLPLRPATVRCVLDALPEEGDGAAVADASEVVKSPPGSPTLAVTEIDPGWVVSQAARGGAVDPLELIAERPWWRDLGAALGEGLARHWRHAVAVSQAARRLARDVGDAEPERVARAGLLHGLGRWAVAAIDPQWFSDWLAESDPGRRRELERRTLGIELTSLGRVLAERWGCDELVVDAAWLHAETDRDLGASSSDPRRLALIQEAHFWAERTPWALWGPPGRDPSPYPSDPRVRLLVAEVQVKCGAPFVEPDASTHEERLARSHARLRRQLGQLRAQQQSRDRFLQALIGSQPTESPETWAERAGLCFCSEPGITAARVVWTETDPDPEAESETETRTEPGESRPAGASPREERPPSVVVPLEERGRRCAEVHLWTEPGRGSGAPGPPLEQAWQAWAALVADRTRLAARLESVVRAHRDRVATEEPRLRQATLDALAEFAAGAGHELNNPLAVIVGRAQLLLVRETDPAAIRSLRAILTQAQRAHRILRDLMYVARPPEPRPRYCQLEEVVRNCVRDLRDSADERGVRLAAEARGPELKVWADPDALRHLTEILVRNALEATPKGGSVQLTTTGSPDAVSWIVQDTGRGITATEGTHLFDPFYCGRQAGRGLGLGLPRAARIVSQAGGQIRWHAAPGQGTIFHVHLPLTEPPRPPQASMEPAATTTAAASSLNPAPKDDQPLPRT
jgi:signal transduction histidine kinase